MLYGSERECLMITYTLRMRNQGFGWVIIVH